jgi:hypothetical protein
MWLKSHSALLKYCYKEWCIFVEAYLLCFPELSAMSEEGEIFIQGPISLCSSFIWRRLFLLPYALCFHMDWNIKKNLTEKRKYVHHLYIGTKFSVQSKSKFANSCPFYMRLKKSDLTYVKVGFYTRLKKNVLKQQQLYS